MSKQRIDDNEKCRQIAGNFDCHTDAAVRCKAYRPMEHIPGFTQSHWMLPSDKCFHRTAVLAAMVNNSVENTKH
jgi:hypothetical protein